MPGTPPLSRIRTYPNDTTEMRTIASNTSVPGHTENTAITARVTGHATLDAFVNHNNDNKYPLRPHASMAQVTQLRAIKSAAVEPINLTDFFNRQLLTSDLTNPTGVRQALALYIQLAVQENASIFTAEETSHLDNAHQQMAAHAKELLDNGATPEEMCGLGREIMNRGFSTSSSLGIPEIMAYLAKLVVQEPKTLDEVLDKLQTLRDVEAIIVQRDDSKTAIPRELTDAIKSLRAAFEELLAQGPADQKINQTFAPVSQNAAQNLGSIWKKNMGSDQLSVNFEHIHPGRLDTNRINRFWRNVKMQVHQLSAKINRVGLLPTPVTSPAMYSVSRSNERVVHEASHQDADSGTPTLLKNLTPEVIAKIRIDIGDIVRNAFTTNLGHAVKKGAGQIANTVRDIRGRPTETPEKTRAELIANMLDLSKPESAINKAIVSLEPKFIAHGRNVNEMAPLEQADFITRMSSAIIDEATRPTRAEAEKAAGIVERLGGELKQELENIHIEGMQAAIDIAVNGGDRTEHIRARLAHPFNHENRKESTVENQINKTSEKIEDAIKATYNKFRKEMGNEFGYNAVKAQLRENSGLEYYRHLLAYGPRWTAAMNVGNRALQLIPTAGPAVALVGQITTLFVSSMLSQAESGLLGSAGADYKPFETTGPRGINDWQTKDMERTHAKAMNGLAKKLGTAYADESNPARRQCAERAQTMTDKGYTSEALLAMAPQLLSLVELDHTLNPNTAIGVDDAVPMPVRISMLLHRHAECLPDLKALPGALGKFDDASRATVLKRLINKIFAEAPEASKKGIDADGIYERVEEFATKRINEAATDGDADGAVMRRALTPSRPVLETCGHEFGCVLDEMLKSGLVQAKELYASKSFLVPQFKGLFTASVATLLIQAVMGTATIAGVAAAGAAATAYAGPAAGAGAAFGVGVAGTVAATVATKAARNIGAERWFRSDEKKQTDYQLFNLLQQKDYNQFLSAEKMLKLHDARVDPYMKTHNPIYEKRIAQIRTHLSARIEDQVVKTAEGNATLGTMLLAAIENTVAGSQHVVTQLIAKSIAAERKTNNASRHAELQKRSTAYQTSMNTIGEIAERVLKPSNPGELIALAQQHEATQKDLYAIKRSTIYLKKEADFVSSADGKVPVHGAIDNLRAQACRFFDIYLEKLEAQDISAHVSQAEWDGLRTVLRLSHTDEITESWIKKTQARLELTGILRPDSSEPYFCGNLNLGDPPKSWKNISEKSEERVRISRIMLSDIARLDAGQFHKIQDPTGALKKMISDPVAAFETIKYDRISSLIDTTVHRGLGRIGATLLPSSPQGIVTTLFQIGALGVWGASLANGDLGAKFKIGVAGQDPAFMRFKDAAHTIPDPSKSGVFMNFAPLASTALANTLGVFQPSGNPASFAAMSHKALFAGSFSAEQPSLWPVLEKIARQDLTHALDPSHWGQGLVAVEALENTALANIGASKINSHHAAEATIPPKEILKGKEQQAQWRAAKKDSAGGFFARYAELLNPRMVLKNAQYGKDGRKHYAMTQHDRHQIAFQFARLSALAQTAPLKIERLSQAQKEGLKQAIDTVLTSPSAQPFFATLAEMGAITAQQADRADVLFDEASTNPWVRMMLCAAYIDLNADADNNALNAVKELHDDALSRITTTADQLLDEHINHRIKFATQDPDNIDYDALEADIKAMEVQVHALAVFAPEAAQERRKALETLRDVATGRVFWL